MKDNWKDRNQGGGGRGFTRFGKMYGEIKGLNGKGGRIGVCRGL